VSTAATLFQDKSHLVATLLIAAMQFVPRDRGEALIRKWLPRGDGLTVDGHQALAMMADAVLLSSDLLLSQPSTTGSTAFDRLAKSRGKLAAAEASAMEALRRSRFRLLQLETDTQGPEVVVRDVMSNERLRLVGEELPPLEHGTALFGRAVLLQEDVCCLPGATTPLDAAAFAVARGHAAAGAPGLAAGGRWAEAVYMHVVRLGTMDVPGLNRPEDFFDDDDDDDVDAILDDLDPEVRDLLMEWSDLDGSPPDLYLLQKTRKHVDLESILGILFVAAMSEDMALMEIADGFQGMLFALLETVQRRERAASGVLTLDGIAQAIDGEIARGAFPEVVRDYFQDCRKQLGGTTGLPKGDDAAMARLMQIIQGLRAKTVAQGCTEHEALAAAEKVAELLDRHGLSLSELEFRAQPCEGIGIPTGRRRIAPIDQCVPPIAAFFDCRVWREHPKGGELRYVFFGLRADVAAAQYLYEMVERAFETETNAFKAGALYASMAGERRTATTSFQTGLARGITGKLRALREARDARSRSESGRDLVPVKAAMVDDELDKLGLNLRVQTRGRAKSVITDAFDAGKEAGERFEVTPGVTTEE